MGKTKKEQPEEEETPNDSSDDLTERGAPVEIATQTELATRRLGKGNRNLSEYIQFLCYDHKDKAPKTDADDAGLPDIVKLAKDVMGQAMKRLMSIAKPRIIAAFNQEDKRQMIQVADDVFRVKVRLDAPDRTFQVNNIDNKRRAVIIIVLMI